MTIKELRNRLGFKSVKALAESVGVKGRTLEAIAMKSEEKQEEKAKLIILDYYSISSEELLNMIEIYNKQLETLQKNIKEGEANE